MNELNPSDRAVLREPEAAVRDRELLEFAALAAIAHGAPFTFVINTGLPFDEKRWRYWNPLTNKGDCKRLAANLGIKETDPLAITRAAAAIGSELRKTASGCSHTARSDDQSKVDDQEPSAGSSHG